MSRRVGRPTNPRLPMTLKEIRELLVLKEWTRTELAKRLGIVRNTVDRWFCATDPHRRWPNKDQVLQMRAWLAEAREATRELEHA